MIAFPTEHEEPVSVHAGACNAGVVRHGDRALIINPGNPHLAQALVDAGVTSVDMILFTHHRRELADGLPQLLEAFSPDIVVPQAEESLFTDPQTYWDNPTHRWRLLCGHVPYHVTHIAPVPVSRSVVEGDIISWHGFQIRVLETPGSTDGSVTYLVAQGDKPPVAFTGDLIHSPGRIQDIHTLQRWEERNGHRVGDYHGFLGAADTVLQSLEHVLEAGPAELVPAHGEAMDHPGAAVELLGARLAAAYRNYTNISALRWYFPNYFELFGGEAGTLPMQPTFPRPDCVRVLNGTTWALVAENGHALLIDPYCEASVQAAQQALDDGTIAAYDAIWITHYHHDHVEGAESARAAFKIPILTDHVMADVVAHPERYFLTCLSPIASTVDHPTQHGETWRWENFTLTAFHFPGQTLYHGGLYAMPDDGPTLFFAGDAVTPTGIDDYCAWNRNWLGQGVGYDFCLRLLRELDPDLVFNQHVDVGFRFTSEAYELMLDTLAQRERLLADLLPWEHSNFGTDERWIAAYPYEQDGRPGGSVEVQTKIFNHAAEMRDATVAPQPPKGWSATPTVLEAPCAAKSEASLAFRIDIPPDATPGRHVIPLDIEFGGLPLGTRAELIVNVI